MDIGAGFLLPIDILHEELINKVHRFDDLSKDHIGQWERYSSGVSGGTKLRRLGNLAVANHLVGTEVQEIDNVLLAGGLDRDEADCFHELDSTPKA